MQKYETLNQKSTEQQITEALLTYDAKLQALAAFHAESSQDKASEHEQYLKELNNQKDASQDASQEVFLGINLNKTANLVEGVNAIAADSIEETFEESATTLSELMTDEDHALLNEAAEAQLGFVNLANIWSRASNLGAQKAMHAAFDKTIWERAKQETARSFEGAQNIITWASSEYSKQAMRVALDKIILERAQELALRNDLDIANAWLESASSAQSRRAMRAALDKIIWDKARESALRNEMGHASTYISWGSSKYAHKVMGKFIKNTQANHEQQRQYQARQEERARREQEAPRTEHQHQHQHHSSAQDTEVKVDKHAETRKIIERAILEEKSSQWLRRASIRDVERVIATIKRLRENALEKGEPMSDRQIYIRYRRSIEGGNPKPELVNSVQILTALMGGKPTGKLPF